MTMPDTGRLADDLTWEYDQAGRTLKLTGPLEEAEALGMLGAVALLPPEKVAGPAELAAEMRDLVVELRSMRPVDAPRRRERRPIDGSKALLTKTEAARA